MRHLRFILAGIITAMVLGLSLPAAVHAALTPSIEGSEASKYYRITFSWPERVTFQASTEGRQLVIRFSEPLEADFSDVLQSLAPHITSASLDEDRKTVRFGMDQPYRIRTFISGRTNGVDMLRDSVEDRTQTYTTGSIEADLEIRVGAHKDFGRIVFDWDRNIEYRLSKDGDTMLVEFNTTAPHSIPAISRAVARYIRSVSSRTHQGHLIFELKVPNAASYRKMREGNKVIVDISSRAPQTAETSPPAPASTPRPVLKPARPSAVVPPPAASAGFIPRPVPKPETVSTAAPAKREPVPSPQSQPEPAAPATENVATPETAAPQTTEEEKEEEEETAFQEPGADGILTPQVTRQENGSIVIDFPWPQRAAAAVFERFGKLWVMFNKRMEMDISPLGAGKVEGLGAVEDISTRNHTVLRLPNEAQYVPQIDKKKYTWRITLARHPAPLKNPLQVSPVPKSPLGKHVFIAVMQAARPALISDPETGDGLHIVPLYEPGQGIAPTRSFIDFTLPQTAQGIVVDKNLDSVSLSMARNGIRIIAPDGLNLSDELPAITPEDTPLASTNEAEAAAAEAATLFPHESWRIGAGDEFLEVEDNLQKQILAAPQGSKNDARLRLAKFYLSHGMAHEAKGLLDIIAGEDPAYARRHYLSALRGFANFLMDRIYDAQIDFGSPELDGIQEVEFWRRAIRVFSGEPEPNFEYLANDKKYIQHYPPVAQRRLGLLAADERIRERDYTAAVRIFDNLRERGVAKPVEKQINYMLGKIYAESGKTDQAIDLWTKLADDYEDRFVRARAGYSLTALLLNEGQIDRQEAIDRLERLRIVWRGDSLELSLLKNLGQLYLDNEEYFKALETWREVVTNFPNTLDATETAQKMSETFMWLFNEGAAEEMEPLDALTLYYEFRELTPAGKEGDLTIQNLADRLVAVDLLDRAASLLTHQVRFRLDGLEKATVATRLALIHLLDHKPQLALDVLEFTRDLSMPQKLRRQRTYIAARALAELDKENQALELIEDDKTEAADLLRVDIYWQMKDWPRVIHHLQRYLVGRELDPTPLSEREAELLLRLAVAYILDDYFQGLGILREKFGPLLREGEQKEMFDFITRSADPVDPSNFSEVTEDISQYESFLNRMRTAIKEQGLSKAIN